MDHQSDLAFLKAQVMVNITSALHLNPGPDANSLHLIISGNEDPNPNVPQPREIAEQFLARVISIPVSSSLSNSNSNPSSSGRGGAGVTDVLWGHPMPTMQAALEDLVRRSGNLVVRGIRQAEAGGSGGSRGAWGRRASTSSSSESA